MPNMKKILSCHNKKVLSEKTTNDKACNCRNKNLCPLEGKCLTSNLIYKATVTTNNTNETKTYIGLCETNFKTRFTNHTKSFRHRKYENETELSKHIWNLRDQGKDPLIKWSSLATSA